MKKYDAAIAGYTCIDLTPVFKKNKGIKIQEILKPGSLTEIEGLSFLPGGVVPNTGMAMKKFNKKVFLNGLIGDDFIGKILTEWLSRCGLTDGIQVTDREGTAFSIVIAIPGVDRIFLESTGCNKIFDTSFIDFKAVEQSRIFHFGYPPLLKQFYKNGGEQLTEMFAKVQQLGVATSLDFSLPDPKSESAQLNWQRILRQALPYVDICTPSLEEALQIMMPEEYTKIQSASGDAEMIDQIPVSLVREIGNRFLSYGVKVVLIKAAHRGAYLITNDITSTNNRLGNTLDLSKWNNCELWCNAYPVVQAKVKNATGAGDTAVAAFLSSILDGNGAVRSLKYAALAGRNNLYCNNLYEELEDWDEMTNEMHHSADMIINLKDMQMI